MSLNPTKKNLNLKLDVSNKDVETKEKQEAITRVYRSKASRIKKDLNFVTKKNRSKLT